MIGASWRYLFISNKVGSKIYTRFYLDENVTEIIVVTNAKIDDKN